MHPEQHLGFQLQCYCDEEEYKFADKDNVYPVKFLPAIFLLYLLAHIAAGTDTIISKI